MLNHQTRWTIEKITQRLELIKPMVYRLDRPGGMMGSNPERRL